MAHLGVTADRQIAYIAGSSHGVVTRAELLGAGLSPDEIRHRAQVGMLIPEYKGVYRVGHQAPSIEARYLAAAPAARAQHFAVARPASCSRSSKDRRRRRK